MVQDFNNIKVSTLELSQIYAYIQDVRDGIIPDDDGILDEMKEVYEELPNYYPEVAFEPTFEEHLENVMNIFYIVLSKRRLN